MSRWGDDKDTLLKGRFCDARYERLAFFHGDQGLFWMRNLRGERFWNGEVIILRKIKSVFVMPSTTYQAVFRVHKSNFEVVIKSATCSCDFVMPSRTGQPVLGVNRSEEVVIVSATCSYVLLLDAEEWPAFFQQEKKAA